MRDEDVKTREDKLVRLFERLATESKIFKDTMQVINEREGYKMTSIIIDFTQKHKKLVNEATSLF